MNCESCIYYPPSSLDGKPCCFCDPIDPLLKIVRDLCDYDISDFLVYIAQMEECVFPDKLNCTVCPFFHLCMFVEFPEDEIRKWLESEVEVDV